MSSSRWKIKAERGLKELAQCPIDNFQLIHRPPYRSLNSGATGIAYTFWKAACLFDEPRWLHQARFWIDHIIAMPEDDRLVKLPEHEGSVAEINVKDSLYHGNRGVFFVQALISFSEHNPLRYNTAVGRFAAPESDPAKVQELLQGVGGRLVGCTILYEETGIEYFRELGDQLAERLIDTADISEGKIPWSNNHRLGLAHGRAGNYYALLLWSKASGFELPEWVYPRLAEYALSGRKQKYGISWPIDERNEERYMNSWCNGAPGLLHLWALAYELSGRELFLETARATGEYCINLPEYSYGHICCGAAGVSYGLLSLNRIDSGRSWLRHAARFAEMAMAGRLIPQYRLSLYTGLAGVVCLMLDMENIKGAGQPAVQR